MGDFITAFRDWGHAVGENISGCIYATMAGIESNENILAPARLGLVLQMFQNCSKKDQDQIIRNLIVGGKIEDGEN